MQNTKRNPVAKALRTPRFRPQTIVPKKGKGAYRRQKGENR